ncbi:glycosyltransferase family 4 protein [Aestuariivivens marinum]|uniref:glycosyltransferase family 4 protein n=1 Tax=Aestuariivivens marinum TaxID=2913555 RepID=UPI001F59BF28|nr:glycosyltransferase [Aestuariivivens marinum]
MKLAIISHTEHYKTQKGELVGWGATVNEINHLLEVFDEIYHVAMLQDVLAPPSALPYRSNRIHFVPIPNVGGKRVVDKLNIIFKAPKTIHIVSKVLRQVDVFQLRTPTGIGVYLIPYLICFVKKPGWYKYAGNWNQKGAPFGYAIQRWLLKKQSRKVTINGFWDNQPKHHLSFENPCLTDEDLIAGEKIRAQKNFNGRLSFCFVGRLEREKGVERIIKAFMNLSNDELMQVGTVHLVGSGREEPYFKGLAQSSKVDFCFHGALPKQEVNNIYQQSHVFLLPTKASEGFPKVIAEAMNFGCIPIVSELSSIGHYIKGGVHGYLLNPVSNKTLVNALKKLLALPETEYQSLVNGAEPLVRLFTFTYYSQRIVTEVLKD